MRLEIAEDQFMRTDTLPETTAVHSIARIGTAKGWHADPFGQHKLRFHDGRGWTEHTTHHGPVPCQGCHRP